MGTVTHLHLIEDSTLAKRRHGEGSLYKRGNVWWISYRHEGRQIRESAGTTDEAAALQLLHERLVEIGKGHGAQFLGWQFSQVANEWYEYIKAPGTLAHSTLAQWRIALDGHLLPLWGETYLHQMSDPSIYEDYIVAKLSGKSIKTNEPLPTEGKASTGPLSPSSITHHLGILSMIFDWALRRGKVSANPVRVANRKMLQEKTIGIAQPFERDEIRALTSHMTKREDRFFVLTLAALGLRIGEAMALKLSTYDPQKRTLQVGATVKREANGHQFLETRKRRRKGKTAAANRTLVVSKHYGDLLNEHIEQLRFEGRITDQNSYIFPNTKGTLKQVGNWRRRVWDPAVTAAGLFDPTAPGEAPKPTPHRLRHTYASEQIAKGVVVSTLSYRMGHANPQTTLSIYTHIFKSHGQEVADDAELYDIDPMASGVADSELDLDAA